MKEIQTRLKVYLSLFILVTLAGTLGFMGLGGGVVCRGPLLQYCYHVQGGVWGHPSQHPWGRAFAVILIIMGGATFLGGIANGTQLLLNKLEARIRMKKVNMVLGTFFK